MKVKLQRDLDLMGGAAAKRIRVPPRIASHVPPPIPPLVPCLSMWRAWASLVAAGLKPIETRTWSLRNLTEPFLGPPFWIALHTAKKLDGEIEGAVRPLPKVKLVPAGLVFAIALVVNLRPHELEDAPRSHVHREDLVAWELEHVTILEPMIRLERGFQKYGHVDGLALRGTRDWKHRFDAATSRDDWVKASTWPTCSIDEARALGNEREKP